MQSLYMDVENVIGIAQLICYSQHPLKTKMVMMNDMLYALTNKYLLGYHVLL
jgi:hypothetical protein